MEVHPQRLAICSSNCPRGLSVMIRLLDRDSSLVTVAKADVTTDPASMNESPLKDPNFVCRCPYCIDSVNTFEHSENARRTS